MLDAGADLKAASEALGHSDPRITMTVYRHVRADQRAQAFTLLAGSLAPIGGSEGGRPVVLFERRSTWIVHGHENGPPDY